MEKYSAIHIFWRASAGKDFWFEAHPSLYAKCRTNRPNSTVVHCALGAIDGGEIEFTCADMKDAFGLVSFVEADESHVKRCLDEGHSLSKVRVPRRSLDGLLEPLTGKVDLLSLDIEGMELQALQGFNIAKYQPEVIIVESNDAKEGQKILTYLLGVQLPPSPRPEAIRFMSRAGKQEGLEVKKVDMNLFGCFKNKLWIEYYSEQHIYCYF